MRAFQYPCRTHFKEALLLYCFIVFLKKKLEFRVIVYRYQKNSVLKKKKTVGGSFEWGWSSRAGSCKVLLRIQLLTSLVLSWCLRRPHTTSERERSHDPGTNRSYRHSQTCGRRKGREREWREGQSSINNKWKSFAFFSRFVCKKI